MSQHSSIGPIGLIIDLNDEVAMKIVYLIMIKVVNITWLKKRAKWASSTALSISASSHMMNGDLPPSSRVTGFRLLRAASSSTILPVSVDPVKATCRRAAEFFINRYKMRLITEQFVA